MGFARPVFARIIARMATDGDGVIICGAGVVGAAVAYYLAQRGVQSTVIEANEVAHGASGRAAGLLTPLDAAQLREPWGPLADLSLRLHRGLADELEGAKAYAFEPRRAVTVARTEAEATALRARQVPGTADWVEASDLTGLHAWLDQPTAGGLALSGAAVLDPGAFTRKLLQRAGATVQSGRVTGFASAGGRITALSVDGEPMACDAAVLTMGPWSAEAQGWLGIRVPVSPLKGQILHIRPAEPPPPGSFSDLDGNYVAAKPGGIVYAGTTEETAGFDTEPTTQARSAILEALGRLTSHLSNGQIMGQTACLRPVCEDGSPLIGASPGLAGAYVAAGHGRKGIMMSLATGKTMAELIATGRCTALDLAPFAPGRFGPPQDSQE